MQVDPALIEEFFHAAIVDNARRSVSRPVAIKKDMEFPKSAPPSAGGALTSTPVIATSTTSTGQTATLAPPAPRGGTTGSKGQCN